MKNLYAIKASNSYQSLLIDNIDEWVSLRAVIHNSTVVIEKSINFHLKSVDKKTIKTPDICTIYHSGIIAFKEELKNLIFPFSLDNINLIPIQVDGKPWFVLSCLQSVTDIDFDNSEVMRDFDGQIFLVIKVRVIDSKAKDWEIFTLDASNRSQLFVTESFKNRIEKNKLKGIEFKLIGEIV